MLKSWFLAAVAWLGIAYVVNAAVPEEPAFETGILITEGSITEVEVDMGERNDTIIKEIAVGFGHSRLSTPMSCKILCAADSLFAINAGNTERSLCRSKLSNYYYGRSIHHRTTTYIRF